jgi:hypothetical protein
MLISANVHGGAAGLFDGQFWIFNGEDPFGFLYQRVPQRRRVGGAERTRLAQCRLRHLLEEIRRALLQLCLREIFLPGRDPPRVSGWICDGAAAIAPELMSIGICTFAPAPTARLKRASLFSTYSAGPTTCTAVRVRSGRSLEDRVHRLTRSRVVRGHGVSSMCRTASNCSGRWARK